LSCRRVGEECECGGRATVAPASGKSLHSQIEHHADIVHTSGWDDALCRTTLLFGDTVRSVRARAHEAAAMCWSGKSEHGFAAHNSCVIPSDVLTSWAPKLMRTQRQADLSPTLEVPGGTIQQSGMGMRFAVRGEMDNLWMMVGHAIRSEHRSRLEHGLGSASTALLGST
jgi:hypothetical protein